MTAGTTVVVKARKGVESSSDPVTEWLESGRRLRSTLEDERTSLHSEQAAITERLKVIDDALIRLSAADAHVVMKPPAEISEKDISSLTISDAIVAAVQAHPTGATLADIRTWLHQVGKRFEDKHLASYLYRLRKMRLISSHGEKGSMVYVIHLNPKEVA